MFPLKPGLYLSVLLTLTFLGPATTGSAQVVCTPVYLNEYLGTSNTPLQPHALKALPDGTTSSSAGRPSPTAQPTTAGSPGGRPTERQYGRTLSAAQATTT